MNKITRYLNQHISGNVFDKTSIRDAYTNDRSIVKNVPRFVVVPENTQDIRKIARFCDQLAMRGFNLPITVRGNGHDKTGAAVGGGMIVSTERLNHIQEIDARGHLVRVQAGVTIGQLNSALSLHGLFLPVDAHPDETIGGLIGNCLTDNYAGKYGGIYNYVDRAEVVLANGDVIQTGVLSRRHLRHKQGQTSFEGGIYRKIDGLIDHNQVFSPKHPPKSLDSAGYRTVALVKQHKTFDLLPLFFASQGTLGIISEIILHVEILPPAQKRLLTCFNSLKSAIDFMNFAKALNPLVLNIYDGRILQSAADHGKKLGIPAKGLDSGFVILVSFNDRTGKSKRKIKKCLKEIPRSAFSVAENTDNSRDFDDLYNALISYLNDDIRGERVAIADDTFIDAGHLQDYHKKLQKLEENYKKSLPFFGSFATANYNVRPEIQLDQIDGRQFALKFLRDYSSLVSECEGSLTGGGPEGCVKTMFAKQPEEQIKIDTEIKEVFDPHNILNPDVKLGADSKTTIRHLRTYYNYYIVD